MRRDASSYRTATLAALLFVLSACDLTGALENAKLNRTSPELKPEKVGSRIGSEESTDWTPSGNILFHIDRIDQTTDAVMRHDPVLGGSARMYVQPNEWITDIRVSHDGTTMVLGTLSRDNPYSLMYVTSSKRLVLARRNYPFWSIAMAHESSMVAFSNSDSLFVTTDGTDVRFVAAGCHAPLAFSPDDTQILCRLDAGQKLRLEIIRLSEQVRLPVPLPPLWDKSASIWWDETGIYSLYRDLLLDVSTWKISPWRSRLSSLDEVGDPNPSENGRRIAFFGRQCLEDSWWYGCERAQISLFVMDRDTDQVHGVAVFTVNSNEYDWSPEASLSPDGSYVAYTTSQGLYLSAVE